MTDLFINSDLEDYAISETSDGLKSSSDNEAEMAAANVAPSLPVLDISLMRGTSEDQAFFLSKLRDILHNYGFFYLAGHGVDAKLTTDAIEATKQFFALPEAEKVSIDMLNSPQFRGYNRAGMELTGGQQDWREQVDFDCEEDIAELSPEAPVWKRALGPNQWPAGLPEFKTTILRYQAEVTRVSIAVLEAIALALGQDKNFFAPMYESGPRQHMKILRYPGLEGSQSDQGVGAHKDGGLVTILLQDVLPGLRVQSQDGSWIDAPPIPGTFIVNTGELLELATNGFVHADIHTVVAPPAGTERFSIPFFFGASFDGTVPLIDLPDELKQKERGVSSDPANPMFRDIGLNHLKARLRSHPDVAQAHYSDVLEELFQAVG
ncbi:isopenicillin N synthase family dioxygenase [Parasphingorhabdus sp.]|uniref:isopenicillin N synthase family dioxygenase n=1 Tax=Parasphingorhabdus sp. TaxID=2709688 RepID=UPI003A8E844D